jgi:cytochrome c biogenesis protein CcdA
VFDASFALALTAGLLAAVNPCGFALLPAYLSLLVVGRPGQERTDGRWAAVGRALATTAAMTLGFTAVFGAFGLLAAPAADVVARNLPWLSIVIGLGLAGLGAWLIAGREVPTLKLGPARGPAVNRRLASMALFGASYAIASLGCTIGPFLAVVVAAFRTGSSPLAGAGLFITYALGMALIVGSVALAVALANASLVRGLRRAAPVISRLGGGLLGAAGLYVAWYGWYEHRTYADPNTRDPVIDAAARVQASLAAWLAELGPGIVGLGFGALLAATAGVTILVRKRPATVTRSAHESQP